MSHKSFYRWIVNRYGGTQEQNEQITFPKNTINTRRPGRSMLLRVAKCKEVLGTLH